MPTSAGEQPSTRAPRCHQETEIASSKKRRKQETRQFPTYRKAHRGDTQTATNESEDTKKREDKLLGEVADCLKLCSRQRLRAVHMSMRQYGNEASRISSKDVIKSLQNCERQQDLEVFKYIPWDGCRPPPPGEFRPL